MGKYYDPRFIEENNPDYAKYKELFDALEETMVGHTEDYLIPALTTLLAIVAVESDAPKRKVLSYIANVLDTVYDRPGYFK